MYFWCIYIILKRRELICIYLINQYLKRHLQIYNFLYRIYCILFIIFYNNFFLAFVPLSSIQHVYFSCILPFWRDNGFNNDACKRFNDYFVKTYVGSEVRQPLFLQNEWNVCNSAIKVIDFNQIKLLFSQKYKGTVRINILFFYFWNCILILNLFIQFLWIYALY